MHTFLDSKTMAKALRLALAERQIDITHSDSLELVARQFGFANWNILAARIDAVSSEDPQLPDGWLRHHGNGRSPGERLHRLGVDRTEPGTILIEALAPAEVVGSQFATLMQSIQADDYRGTRLRVSAELSGEGVGRGALWLRIDDRAGKVLAFDNMMAREDHGALGGTFGWTRRDIVVDVPLPAESLHYGAMLTGAGRLRVRDFRIEAADAGDEPTDQRGYPRRPTNLGFGSAPSP
jgi:hypothetical protein